MITEANTRNICVVASTSVTNGATASGSFDVRGFDFAQINVFKSVSAAVTTLKVEQSDDDSTYVTCNLTSGTDFTAATNGTSALTGVGAQPYYSFNIDTRALRRYLKVTVTPADTTVLFVHASLGRRQIGAPVTGTDGRTIISI